MLKIYKASAGSGKTYTLAYEYIKALLGIKIKEKAAFRLNHPHYLNGESPKANRHRHILAITFTNKATEEMKRRIVNELDALSAVPAPSSSTDAAYAAKLCADFGCGREHLAETAAMALKQLLYDYHSFNVTTIDSFFQRVLRTFARELDRQGDFSIELNDLSVVKQSVDEMIDDFNNDVSSNPQLGEWIYNYMYRQLESGGKTNFFNRKSQLHNMLVGIVTHICEEKFKPFAADMQKYLANPKHLKNLSRAFENRKKALLDKVAEENAKMLKIFADADITFDQMRKNLTIVRLMNDEFPNRKPVPAEMFTDTIEGYISGEKTPFLKKFKGTQEHVDMFADFLAAVRGIYVEYCNIEALDSSIEQLGLLAYAWRYLDNYSSENNTVLLSDTNHLLSKIIGEEETPFIYEKMGVELRNFLIDEFQDTSRMQWKNLMPLVSVSLLDNNDSLIIGDEKQSIYRFRNSDSSLLHHEVAEVDFASDAYETRTFGNGPGENTNYRSAPAVVRFNNTLFANLASLNGLEGFENVVQDIPSTNAEKSGYVAFVPVTEEDKKKNDDADVLQEPSADPISMMAENMMRQKKEGKYDWADIAVLVATNLEAAEVVDRLLRDYPDIPVLSDEALYVKKSPAVQLIIGVLKILSSGGDSKKEIIKDKYPTPTELARVMSRFEYFRKRGEDVEQAIESAMKCSDDQSVEVGIDAIKARKPSSLVSLIETIIHEQISDDDRRTQVAYLTAFQDFVADYCSHSNPSVTAFLNAWETHKDKLSISAAADVDAVKVMTVHKSKGLEFDCVHIPFGSWKERGRPRGEWIQFPQIEGIDEEVCPPAVFIKMDNKCFSFPESYFYSHYVKDSHERLIDTMNMTYVAYTRAGAELIVYYKPSKNIGEYVVQAICEGSPDAENPLLCDLTEYFDSSTGAFVMGAPTVKTKKQKDKDAESAVTLRLTNYDVFFHEGADVLTRVSDVLDLDKDIDDVSAKEETSSADEFADEESRQRGVLLHEVLSLIESKNDTERAVRIVSLGLRLSPDEEKSLLDEITEMISVADPRVATWFDPSARVLNEQAIYMPDKEETRRLDRIVFCPDGEIDVVDYKFTSERRSSHKRQVEKYVKILGEMGYDNVKGFLWYPLMKRIVEVDTQEAADVFN